MGSAIRLLFPSTSMRGQKLRGLVSRWRHHRAIKFSNARYNLHRQNYYEHAPVKLCSDESLKVSILVPCFNTPKKYFEPLLASVFAQGYNNWELIVADASTDQAKSNYLAKRSRSDTRIVYKKIDNEGIALNTNKGIELVSGDLVAFLDHDDLLDPDALAETVNMFLSQPSFDLVYSDEDKVSDDGERYFEPHFKPDFSIDMLRNVNYITHFVVVRKEVIAKIKGLHAGLEGAQDYDFLLRVVDAGAEIGHVSKVLYHWRQAEGSTAADFSNKQHVTVAGCTALQAHYKRNGINAKARVIQNRPGFYKAEYPLEDSNLRIFIDLSGVELLPAEKARILDYYRNNKDIVKHGINIIEGPAPQKVDETSLIVKGAYIPAHASTDIASLFGLIKEEGVSGVAPRIVQHGRIADMGLVKVGNSYKPLFKGINPERRIPFGATEWVRNVDKLTGNVGVYKSSSSGRQVIWSHSEFVAFTPLSNSLKKAGYYNPNLYEQTEIVDVGNDYIMDLVDVNK